MYDQIRQRHSEMNRLNAIDYDKVILTTTKSNTNQILEMDRLCMVKYEPDL